MKKLAVISCAAAGLLALPPAVYAVNEVSSLETSVSGTVLSVFGNRFVLEVGTGKLLVDAGPSWYRKLSIGAGDEVAVTGPREHGKVEALSFKRGDGSLVNIRSASDRPPWAGERRGFLDKLGISPPTSETTFEGTVTDVFGNDFVVEVDDGAVLVDAGPAWYRRFDVRTGERITVSGHLEDKNVDAVSLVREGGTTERVRPSSGRPPWAGKKGWYLSSLR